MFWFNFILDFDVIFLCFGVWLSMIMSVKQREIKFKPRITPGSCHNIYIENYLTI